MVIKNCSAEGNTSKVSLMFGEAFYSCPQFTPQQKDWKLNKNNRCIYSHFGMVQKAMHFTQEEYAQANF